MKILMTADTVGGVWVYSLELARALAAEGIEVALATQGARLSEDQWAEARAIPNLEVFESTYKLEWMPDPWDDVMRCAGWLLDLAARVKPAVVHANQYVHASLPFRVPTVLVGHSCVMSWWAACKRGEPVDAGWDRYQREVGHGLRVADAVVAPSRTMLRELSRYYGPLPDGRVIPNGRDASGRRPGKKEPFVLAAGRLWDVAKNVAALEAAAPGLPWPVFLAGEGREPGPGIAAPGQVHPLGRLPSRELDGWFSRAALYALPARYEPFGLSVLEAAQAGCALVLGDIDSLREQWEGCALFVPPDDVDVLRAALKRLMARPAEREALADRARRRALELTPEAMASRYAALYRELVAAPTSARRPASSEGDPPCAS